MLFYYAPAWLDSIQIENLNLNGTLEGILAQAFEGTKINWLVMEEKVILTYNSPILTKIRFDTTSTGNESSDYILSREYQQSESKLIEEQTFVIGRKSQMVTGGVSFLSGFIKSVENKEALTGVYVQSEIASSTSDSEGFYTIKVPNGKSVVRYQYTGMKSTKRNLVVFSDGALSVSMIPDIVMLPNFTVQADADKNVSGVQMGVYKLSIDKMKTMPKVLGENDILKVALTLPGVQNVGEGAAGINVRGGKSDQNLILLNNASIYNPFHFFGFFSSFNADLLASTELYKSSIPVNYGGRLSSVLDVKLNEGNKRKVEGKGGLGIVTSSLALEIPLVKNRTSLTMGGRTTYSDWVLDLVEDEDISNSDPFFYDASLGVDHVYGRASHFNVSGYYSYDKFKLSTDSLYSYDNLSLALNWKHNFNDKLSARLIGTHSRYQFRVDYDALPESAFDYGFAIGDYFTQVAFDYSLNKKHTLTGGFDGKVYEIDPIFRKPSNELSTVVSEQVEGEQGLETSVFFSDAYEINARWSIYAGIRFSFYSDLGPGTALLYQPGVPKGPNTVVDSVSFDSGQFIQTYQGPEYRTSIRYSLTETQSLKASFNRTRQYLHTLSNTVSVSPVDIWKLSDNNIKPQIGDQVSLGYFQNFKENAFETSLELYYKKLDNIIDYKTNANLVLNQNLEADILQGEGKAYGIELFVKKNTGDLTGWASYTYSRSLQRYVSDFEEEIINRGEYFPANFDKPHVFNFVGNYALTKRYSLSMNVSYASGRPVTYPTASYQIGGTSIVHFADRNRFRIPDYFRIDIGVNIEGNHKIKKLAHGFWSINIYNVLGRDNPYSVYFSNDGGKVQGYRLSVLGAPIPSISYNFEF